MSQFEKFEMVEMHRKDIKKCPYNPRKITAEAKRRLKAGLERFGLVQPLIFNKQSGTLVGGHQRLACLDDIHETKDYSLNIAVVDIDESKEKELVVFLNNTSTMGYWDDDAVLNIFTDESIDKDFLGFAAQESEYFERLLKENTTQSDAMDYFKEMEESYDALKANAEETKDENEAEKLTRKQKWEESVSQFFPAAPAQSEVNSKPMEELTDDEKKNRIAFRAQREDWKKKDTDDEEVIVRIMFTSGDSCRKWLQKIGIPPGQHVIHEKELT